MLKRIINIFQQTDFDFRKYTNPNDIYSYLFDEWVPYYRMKYSLSKTINPRSILEIGVRYGYSAITFLESSPEATYLGIDNNSDNFGGSEGAIEWAKKITGSYKANFLIADSQQMTSFPGDFYDLIHIDGQQDGDGTIHDLELALEKGAWILLDGFFWSTENMLSSTYFLEKYKRFIEFSCIIPSYAGELLIKTTPSARHILSDRKDRRYSLLKKFYDSDYYLKDCGGYEQFKRNKGIVLEDPRLLTAYYIADPYQGKKILDLGCGRGELPFALARAGGDVTGIDYSASAIKIARDTFCNDTGHFNLQFFNDDFLKIIFENQFDVITATDFVEHIEPEKLGLMLERIAEILAPGGLFIVHTSPNLLYYQYGYEEKRKLAKQAGSYLPKNPRTFYEDLMHINEQSPESLQNSLQEYFKHCTVWTTTLPDPVGSLERDFSLNEIIQCRDIFAVASHSPIHKEDLLLCISQQKLDTSQLAVILSSETIRIQCNKKETLRVNIVVENRSPERFISLFPNPVHISYHWVDNTGNYEVFEGIRTPITMPLKPSETRSFTVKIIAPEKSGTYRLQITLVQEFIFWFEQVLKNLPLSIEVTVL